MKNKKVLIRIGGKEAGRRGKDTIINKKKSIFIRNTTLSNIEKELPGTKNHRGRRWIGIDDEIKKIEVTDR